MKKYFEFEARSEKARRRLAVEVGEECGNGTMRKEGASNSMCNPVDKLT